MSLDPRNRFLLLEEAPQQAEENAPTILLPDDYNENDFVNVGSNIIEIENLDSLIIKTSINEEERSLINFDTVVEITNNLNTETAKIISISPTANQLTQKFDLEIELRNSSFIPGQNISINFVPTKQERIFIPSNSIYIKNNQTFIYTLNLKNQVVKTEILIGNVIGSYTEVLSELDNATRLVKSNIYSLEDNERIEIANPIKITRD